MEEVSRESVQAVRRMLLDQTHSNYAPREVVQAVLALTFGDEVLHAVSARQTSGSGTEWRCIALTAQGLLYVTANSSVVDWDNGSHSPAGATSSAHGRLIPFREVSGIVMPHLEDNPQAFNTGLRWAAKYAALLRDGTLVEVPPFAELPTGQQSESVVELVAALWQRISPSSSA